MNLTRRDAVGVRSLLQAAQAAQDAVNMALLQYREGKTDFNRVFTLQIALAVEQDRLAQTQGELARSLVEIYRALGGGWQIRFSPGEPVDSPAAMSEESP